MSSTYKVTKDALPHFVIFSVLGWIEACLPAGSFPLQSGKFKTLQVFRFSGSLASGGL